MVSAHPSNCGRGRPARQAALRAGSLRARHVRLYAPFAVFDAKGVVG